MLRTRISVFLMMYERQLIKSKKFKDYRYLGDPLNAVKIFSDLKADELILFDIGCRRENNDPDFDFLKKIAEEARMPICYGGGINNIKQISQIIHSGIEKVSLSYSAFENPSLIREASNKFGKQSIVCCLDVKIENNKNYNIYVNNGSKKIRINLKQAILNFVNNGAGEIIINNIDRDGTYSGVDKQLIKETLEICTIPITFVGGLSSYSNIKELNQEFDISGLSAGSLWSFLGKNGPVMLNYPSSEIKNNIS